MPLSPIRSLVAGIVLLLPASALAHDLFEITTGVRAFPEELDLTITMARATAHRVCPGLAGDAARPELVPFEQQRPGFERCALELYAITHGSEALLPREARATLTVENDVEMRLVYPGPSHSPLRLEAKFFDRLPDPTYGAVITAHYSDAFLGQQLVNAEVRAFEAVLPAPPVPEGAPVSPAPAPSMPTFAQYLKLGVEHIVTGYDHLLFLFGLLAVCRRWQSILTIVTCFTVAHSITLVLAALDVFTLPGRWVEPLIAASIVFVGIENLVRGEEPRGRWVLTFAFGLIHGFGFAGVLRELGLGANGAPIVLPVLAFNLGVELGQAAIAALALPLLWRLGRHPILARRTATALSVVVAAFGLYWFLERTVFA